MDKQYLVPIIIAALLLLALAGGAWYFIYKILHPSFETSPVTQLYTQTTTTQYQESAPSTAVPAATTVGEIQFSYPYPVSWEGYNKTNISLAGVSLAKKNEAGKENYILNLNLKINTANSSFCSDSFKDYSLRRLINEQGELASPDIVPLKCLNANSADNQIIGFVFPAIEKEISIQVFNPNGQLQTFFIVRITGSNKLEVEPAPKEG